MNYELRMNNLLVFLIIIGFLLPSFCLGQAGPPQIIESLKTTLGKAVKFFPETLGKLAGDIVNWLKNIWNSYIYPFLHKIWQKIDSIFGKEIGQRGPVIKEEFKKETQEMKQEVPSLFTSLWQKIKDFFRFK